MKNAVGLLGCSILSFSFASAPLFGQTVHSRVDGSGSFSSYHTYSWSGKVDDSQDGRTVRDAMNKDLGLLGWRMVPSGGDVRVTATIAAKAKQHRVNQGIPSDYSVSSPTHFAANYPRLPDVVAKKKELDVRFVDARSGSSVWTAEVRWQSSRSVDDPRRDIEDKKLEQVVDKVFKKFAKAR